MDKDTNTRIQALEETLAHLTRVTDDLHEVIARQDADIATLTRRVEMLMRFAADQQAGTDGQIPLADQRPPHW